MDNSMTDRSAKEDKQKLRLPKNIRQIGNIQGAVRIYVEDYVYTYLHGNSRPEWAHKGSIFLGNRCQENGQKYFFISGLVHIPDENFTDGIPDFTDLMWGGVYQEMKQFYEDVEILGWGMDVAGASAKLTGDLEQIHRKAFQGQDKLLFLMDSLEKEEAFYVHEKNMLRRRDGYYVYYEKNPQMQEYMMQGKEEKGLPQEIDPQRTVVTNYRAITAEKKRRHGTGSRAFVYVACLALLIAVSAMSVNMMSSAGKIQRLEEAVSFLEADKTSVESGTETALEEKDPTAELPTESTLSAEGEIDHFSDEEEEKNTDEEQDVESEASQAEEKDETADDQMKETEEAELSKADDEQETENEPEPSIKPQPEEKKEENVQTQETSTTVQQDYYVVQKGESLLGISQKIYGKDYTEQLCTLNELEDENKIYAGQKLLLLNKS